MRYEIGLWGGASFPRVPSPLWKDLGKDSGLPRIFFMLAVSKCVFSILVHFPALLAIDEKVSRLKEILVIIVFLCFPCPGEW